MDCQRTIFAAVLCSISGACGPTASACMRGRRITRKATNVAMNAFFTENPVDSRDDR
jgi:hypothetical protein